MSAGLCAASLLTFDEDGSAASVECIRPAGHAGTHRGVAR